MDNQARQLTRKLQNGLQEMAQAHQQVVRVVDQLFHILEEKKLRFNIDAATIANKLHITREGLETQTAVVQDLLAQAFELARTSVLISASLDLEQVLEEVMDTVVALTKAERAYLMLRDEVTNEMSIVAARNWERTSMDDDDIVFSLSVVNTVLENGEPLISANAMQDDRFQTASSIFSHMLRSILCIPVVLRGEIIGVLYADNPLEKGLFRNESLPILSAFAQQTAIAIENARLYRELERANEHLIEANRLKSEFLGVISHEMKTPFSSIGMSVQIFEQASRDKLDKQQQEVWADLTKGIDRAQQVVNSLVNYAGLLSKQGQLDLQMVNITELIDAVVRDAERLVAARQLTLQVEVPRDVILPKGDYERLSEAVWHLLQNAMQYNKPNGNIIIRADRHADHVRIEVEDTGRGIPPDQQERIWQDFEQMSDSLRRGVEGLGLGLPLVRYVTLAHGGTVELESEPGVGSRFTMLLPLSPS